ncbi:MAG: nucleotide exchange factor GrpE [Candidatus Firestonebacteria bacterium RIFOXYC2_FULL_39_67]|nr:MAG: nucleotide exchange factor GrpE [Candidatus Firestonebacteria bacterium RIFOXYD2_FULL_39_29]OGF55568.1 MAG: nucleotide exchange factor GrpE [Candidatus Firestonebacteria bacterium RIFOXYC2_FULL_39_67]
MKEEHKHKHEEAPKAENKPLHKEEEKVEVPLSPSEKEIKKLSEELAKAKEEALLNKDKALRAMADLNNASKRLQKEKEDFVKYAAGELAQKLIPALDDFENAIKGEAKVDENFLKGVKMIYGNLKEALEKEGLKKQETEGKKFDPNMHEVVATEPTEDAKKDGMVAEVFRPGYMFKDIVIRPAMVKVYKKTEEVEEKETTPELKSAEKIEKKEEGK